MMNPGRIDYTLKLSDDVVIPDEDKTAVKKWLKECEVKMKHVLSPQRLYEMNEDFMIFGHCGYVIEDGTRKETI